MGPRYILLHILQHSKMQVFQEKPGNMVSESKEQDR